MGSASYVLLFGLVVFSSASGALFVTVLDLLRRNRTGETPARPVIQPAEESPPRQFGRPGRPDAA
jgi:hypothetical protein